MTDLYAGYLGRVPDGYGGPAWLAALNNGTSREEVRHGFGYSAEFQNDVAQLCVTTSSSNPNYKYVLSDLQGTTRAVMNNYGSSSAVIARHDYLPFGEEIWTGSYRSSSYSYGNTDANRQKYGLTERDDATGLDHTWWRKYESFSGRWTTPDSFNSSANTADPQSLNRYSYTQNDPVNFVDPTGQFSICFGFFVTLVTVHRDAHGNIDQIISVKSGGFIPTMCFDFGGGFIQSGGGIDRLPTDLKTRVQDTKQKKPR